MPKKQKVIFISDDTEDEIALNEVMKKLELDVSVHFFSKETEAINFAISIERPLLFIYDLDPPKADGLAFIKKVDEEPKVNGKFIPVLFVISSAKRALLKDLYSKARVQGIFEKPLQIEKLQYMITVIVWYWQLCKVPSNFL